MEKITGRCLCGAVEYSALQPGVFVTCYCRDCRYASGGGPANVLVVQQEGFEIHKGDDNLHTFNSISDAGTGVTREFCTTCGTHLFERLEILEPKEMLIKVGTIDDQKSFKPEVTVWTKSAPEWAKIQEASLYFEENPDPAAVVQLATAKTQ